MIRIGTVQAVDLENDAVIVCFQEDEIVSDWLPVVRQCAAWLPEIGQTVLCLFEDEFNPAGYVLGGML